MLRSGAGSPSDIEEIDEVVEHTETLDRLDGELLREELLEIARLGEAEPEELVEIVDKRAEEREDAVDTEDKRLGEAFVEVDEVHDVRVGLCFRSEAADTGEKLESSNCADSVDTRRVEVLDLERCTHLLPQRLDFSAISS